MELYTRYRINEEAHGFLRSDESCRALIVVIEDIERTRANPANTDVIYNDWCRIYHEEMKKWFRTKNIHPSAMKGLKKCKKPFWNDNLQILWRKVHESENNYLSAKNGCRQQLLHQFRVCQKHFDRDYRKAKRRYEYEKQENIEILCTSNPKEF